MAQQAQVSIGTFLDCCVRQITAQASTINDAYPVTQQQKVLEPAEAAEATVEAARTCREPVGAGRATAMAHTPCEAAEEFWDATDLISLMSGID